MTLPALVRCTQRATGGGQIVGADHDLRAAEFFERLGAALAGLQHDGDEYADDDDLVGDISNDDLVDDRMSEDGDGGGGGGDDVFISVHGGSDGDGNVSGGDFHGGAHSSNDDWSSEDDTDGDGDGGA